MVLMMTPTKFARVVLDPKLCEREGIEFAARLGGTKHLLLLSSDQLETVQIQDFSDYIQKYFRITSHIALYTSDGFRIPHFANLKMLDEPEIAREICVCVAPGEVVTLSQSLQVETASQCSPTNDALAVRLDAEAENTSEHHGSDYQEHVNADDDVDSGVSDSGEDEGQTITETLVNESLDDGLSETDTFKPAATAAEGYTDECSSKHSLGADLIQLDVDKEEGKKRKISMVEDVVDKVSSKVTKTRPDASPLVDRPSSNPVEVGLSLESTPNESLSTFKRPSIPRRKSSRNRVSEKRVSPVVVLSGTKESSAINLGGDKVNTMKMKNVRRSIAVPSRRIKLPLTPIRKSMPAMGIKTFTSTDNDLPSEVAPKDLSKINTGSLSPISNERLEKVVASASSTIKAQEIIDIVISPEVNTEVALPQSNDITKLEEDGTSNLNGSGSNIDKGSVEKGQVEESVPRDPSCDCDIQ